MDGFMFGLLIELAETQMAKQKDEKSNICICLLNSKIGSWIAL